MGDRQAQANRSFTRAVLDSKHMISTAGRSPQDRSKIRLIWKDIADKLDLHPDQSFLDIGCGYGLLTKLCLSTAKRLPLRVSLIDIPEILQAVKTGLLPPRIRHIRYYPGTFPKNWPVGSTLRFDRILAYSVLHYTSNPEHFIDRGVSLLRRGGRFLIGDIPNISRKGRFLCSDFGRRFEARYRGTSIRQIPHYRNLQDFMNKNNANPLAHLNDCFIQQIFKRYTNCGYDVYVLAQPSGLPYCHTREDLLIVNRA